MSAYVHTFLQLSKYVDDLVSTEAKKLKRLLNGLNPLYKKMVVASNKPTTFDDVVDRALTTEEVHREELAENSKRSCSSSWFKSGGGQFKNKKQKFKLIGLRHVGGLLEHA